ncbi:ATP-binding protein [Candidatus Woesearchaeota archaeon]|jgi:uncharacterized protein|nr:ATP-binding protein [Candidatus Woesearchaeota archaeon]MBT4387641.1 ATP-binding protein [Candidatus Woesearchaeota archaeon]MBT4595996.1 ATP-binding protein [Candidatus Woesearchaeota archaeon]MBT5741015.1 ATP-binding protein [Candidatus Woesearchaeota archaeon]MBT6505385.1 ATP-binding protein [Candidatus Woesearchaeota archaeon]
MKEIIKQKILDFKLKESKQRDIKINLKTNSIITLIGPRRSGKTFLFFNMISKLNKYVYINFEDDRLNIKEPDEVLDAIMEIYYDQDLKKFHFFFDEIHMLNNWEKFIRRINDEVTNNIYLTGSSAKLLSTEISTSLRGRSISYQVLPLSFKEYINFKNIDYSKITSQKKSEILSEFNKYLMNGGYPELINYDKYTREKQLKSYLDVMIFRDLIERFNIKNITATKYFINKNINSVSTFSSVAKTFNQLQSLGVKVSKDFLYELADHVQDIFLFFYLEKYDKSISKRKIADKKIYCIDNGFINLISAKEDYGRLLENIVFIELKRLEKEVFYHKDKYECDFIILEKGKIIQAIQVTKSISEDNWEREINGLLESMNKFNLKEGFILTSDFEDKKKINGKKIIIIPVWKWLLNI